MERGLADSRGGGGASQAITSREVWGRRNEDQRRLSGSLRTAPSRPPLPHQKKGHGDVVLRCRPRDTDPGKFPPVHPICVQVCEGKVSPPFRWQAGKVWQGVGSAVRLPPRSPPWWILASRPSAPWLLTGIPDAIGPLSSRSTLPGPSALPFQARAPSSTSAEMTRRAQCLYGVGWGWGYTVPSAPHTAACHS